MSDYMKNQGYVHGISGCRNRQRQLEAEIERLETFNRANWAALQEAQRQIERLQAKVGREKRRADKAEQVVDAARDFINNPHSTRTAIRIFDALAALEGDLNGKRK